MINENKRNLDETLEGLKGIRGNAEFYQALEAITQLMIDSAGGRFDGASVSMGWKVGKRLHIKASYGNISDE